MNRDEAIRRAEIAMAWARGEEVQQSINGNWISVDSPEDVGPECKWGGPEWFDWRIEFRIKPKPLECWVWCWVEADGSVSFSDQRVRREETSPLNGRGRWVRMVEKQ